MAFLSQYSSSSSVSSKSLSLAVKFSSSGPDGTMPQQQKSIFMVTTARDPDSSDPDHLLGCRVICADYREKRSSIADSRNQLAELRLRRKISDKAIPDLET